MKIIVHVATADDIGPAREAAEATMQPGDELEVVVGQPSPRSAETQPQRNAVGYAPQQK